MSYLVIWLCPILLYLFFLKKILNIILLAFLFISSFKEVINLYSVYLASIKSKNSNNRMNG